MARFRGIMRGNRGEASRLGSPRSGLEVEAASWQGKVTVELHVSNADDTDLAEVWLEPHHGRGVKVLLYRGPVGSFQPSAASAAQAPGNLAGPGNFDPTVLTPVPSRADMGLR